MILINSSKNPLRRVFLYPIIAKHEVLWHSHVDYRLSKIIHIYPSLRVSYPSQSNLTTCHSGLDPESIPGHNNPMTICGLDECGRGSLAGPLVAASAVILIDIDEFVSILPAPLRDSKKLSHLQRQKIVNFISTSNVDFQIESVSVAEINENGIGWANKVIFERLIAISKSDKYIVDGNLKFSDSKVESVIKADDIYPQVMLASIIAKEYRDKLLQEMHSLFPHFGWDTNAGYGSAHHIQALKERGLTPHHRKQFCITALSH